MQRYQQQYLIGLCLIVNCTSVIASGVMIDTQNAAGIGYAFAGAGAVTSDASAAILSPARMVQLAEGWHVTAALGYADASLQYQDHSTLPVNPLIPVGQSQTFDQNTPLATVHAVYHQQEWAVGASVTPLYGNNLTWDRNFIGRYQGVKTDVKGINLAMSAAYALSTQWSIGAGFDVLDLQATLTRQVPIVTPQAGYITDAEAVLSGQDRAWGGHVGVLWSPTPQTQIALNYRSQIDLDLDGTLQVNSPYLQLNKDVQAQISMPQSVDLAAAYQWSPTLTLMGNLAWFDWSVLPEINAKHQQQTVYQETLDFKDGWRAGLGALYQYNDRLQLRTGIAYDRSIVKNPQSRTVRFPDTHRTWLSVGMGYQLSKTSSVDVGLSYLVAPEVEIERRTLLNNQATAQVMTGTFQTTATIVGVQYNHQF